MKKIFTSLFTFIIISSLVARTPTNTKELYNQIGLSDIMTYELFEKVMGGYNKIEKRKSIISFVDYTKSRHQERMYVIDIENKKILFRLHVAHGVNSGKDYATSFSNIYGSLQSSLGFLLTEHTYENHNGYCMRLRGLEEGINHNVKERFIVMHGAVYVNPSKRNSDEYGLSKGCLSLAQDICTEVIDVIKDGSVIFVYANQSEYMNNSKFM